MKTLETATIAGGCFWCIQGPFDAEEGVHTTSVGYAIGPSGTTDDATYYSVASGATDHREAVQLTYDPEKISYRTILEIFFRQIDPTDPGGQFADRGHQYTTAVYAHSEAQRTTAEAYITELEAGGKYDAPVATTVEDYIDFVPAEEEHQQFYLKQPSAYSRYKEGSGRADYLRQQEE